MADVAKRYDEGQRRIQMTPEKPELTFRLRKPSELPATPEPFDLMKALAEAERQVRLYRAEITTLHKKFKLIERRLAKLEVRREPVSPPFTGKEY